MPCNSKFLADEKAATAIEYALIALLVSVAIILGVKLAGDTNKESYTNTSDKISDAIGAQ